MAANMFQELQRTRQLLEVGMDEIRMLLPGDPIAIGTQNLNSCSCIVIIGEGAIVLAHIAPLPPHPLGASPSRVLRPGEAEAHFERMRNQIRQLYRDNRMRFHSQKTAWAIFGVYDGEAQTPEKFELARRVFRELGFAWNCAWYPIAPP